MRRILTTMNTGTGGLHFSFLFSREDDALCRVRRSVLVPAFIMTTTKKKTKKNGELNCISNAFCMLRTYFVPTTSISISITTTTTTRHNTAVLLLLLLLQKNNVFLLVFFEHIQSDFATFANDAVLAGEVFA